MGMGGREMRSTIMVQGEGRRERRACFQPDGVCKPPGQQVARPTPMTMASVLPGGCPGSTLLASRCFGHRHLDLRGSSAELTVTTRRSAPFSRANANCSVLSINSR